MNRSAKSVVNCFHYCVVTDYFVVNGYYVVNVAKNCCLNLEVDNVVLAIADQTEILLRETLCSPLQIAK